MKLLVLGVLLIIFATFSDQLCAQKMEEKNLFRVYEDNDLLNYRGRGTDEAYTSGFRMDIFFEKRYPSRFILDRLLPIAGKGSINIFQWGIMQVMYTPRDICVSTFQPNDYCYAGGLFVIHSLYSYNYIKKYGFQTEFNLGAVGPLSMAEEAQKIVHHIIHYQQPMGWDYQLKNDLILNINFTAEKQFFSRGRYLEFIGATKVQAGTRENVITVYSLIRIGKMSPYFAGYICQYSGSGNSRSGTGNDLQIYFSIRPEISRVLTNALLEGGVFVGHTVYKNDELEKYKSYQDLEHIIYALNCGATVVCGHVGLSVTQNASSMLIKGTYNHSYGNISVYFSW